MMEVKDKIEIINLLMKSMQQSFDDEVPPSIVMYSEKYGIVQMIFTQMDNQKEKEEIAFSGMLLAALIGDVEIMGVISEAWGVALDPVKDKAIYDACGNDPSKISTYLHGKWPSFKDCPYRTEMYMGSLCDGKNMYMISQDIEYDEKGKRISKDLDDNQCRSDQKSERDFNVTFNSLLCKSEMLTDAMAILKALPFYPGHVTIEFQEIIVRELANHVGYDFDVKKVVRGVNKAYEGAKKAYVEENSKPDGAPVH